MFCFVFVVTFPTNSDVPSLRGASVGCLLTARYKGFCFLTISPLFLIPIISTCGSSSCTSLCVVSYTLPSSMLYQLGQFVIQLIGTDLDVQAHQPNFRFGDLVTSGTFNFSMVNMASL